MPRTAIKGRRARVVVPDGLVPQVACFADREGYRIGSDAELGLALVALVRMGLREYGQGFERAMPDLYPRERFWSKALMSWAGEAYAKQDRLPGVAE